MKRNTLTHKVHVVNSLLIQSVRTMAEELQGDIRPYATEEDVKSMVYDLYGMKVRLV